MTIVIEELTMRSVAAGEFKAKCLSILEDVRSKRKRLIITKRGEPIAEIVPISKKQSPEKHKLRGSVIYEGDILSPIDVEWEALK